MAENSGGLNGPYSPFAIAGCILAVVTGAAEILAGLGNRWGLWDYRTGLLILRWAAYAGGTAAIISLIGGILTWPGHQRRGFILSLTGLLFAGLAFGIPWCYGQMARQVPAIHDITTDTNNPPLFVAVLPLRKETSNPAEYGGPEIAAKQHAAYPDISPLELPLPPDKAFQHALDAARDLGWQIVEAKEQEGRIEATDTTFWFGFKDDIVIRIAKDKGGSRIDVRSLSRVGKSDIGTNAKRIRRYLKKLTAAGMG